MSLDWTVEEVDAREELHSSEIEWAKTNALIWLSVGCGYNEITEANADEIFERVSVWERVFGSFNQAYDRETDTYADSKLTLADVRRRVGLSTNANVRTRSSFRKMISEKLEEDARYERKRQQEKQED